MAKGNGEGQADAPAAAGYSQSSHSEQASHPEMIARTGADVPQRGAAHRNGDPAQRHLAQAQPVRGAAEANGQIEHNAIGRIDKVVGDITVVRNGVTVALHAGDAVYKNDVIKTGSGSS